MYYVTTNFKISSVHKDSLLPVKMHYLSEHEGEQGKEDCQRWVNNNNYKN